MAYNFTKNLTTVNYNKGGSKKRYIVIHYTGNQTDTAAANANYFKNTNRGASAHYFVDGENVVQVVEDFDTAWAVGRNYGGGNLFGTVTNSNSISIEMCSTNGAISSSTYANTVALTAQLMNKYSISASNVYRHFDVCSKICPGWNGWTSSNDSIWRQFKSDISSGTTSVPPTAAPDQPSVPQVPSSAGIDISYAVMIEGGRTLPVVTNLSDYAGIRGKRIVGFMCKSSAGSVKYRVHRKGIGWLPYVTGFNWSDDNNGYAGDAKTPIDAIEVYLYSPNNDKCVYYKVSPLNKNYYDYQRDTDKGNGMDGYAGSFGKDIDRIQMYIK